MWLLAWVAPGTIRHRVGDRFFSTETAALLNESSHSSRRVLGWRSRAGDFRDPSPGLVPEERDPFIPPRG